MKKFILLSLFALYSAFAFPATVTIINQGFEFSPDDVTINVGDTIVFQLQSSHDAVEVSETTWNAGGNSPLPGFSVPFGGGQVTGLTAGLHFYVCTPHAAFGMKGKITVAPVSGISDTDRSSELVKIYPNPNNGIFTLQFNNPDINSGTLPVINEQSQLEIFNSLGEEVYVLPGYITRPQYNLDFTSLPDGIYFVRISDRKKIYTQKLVKH